MTLANKVSIMSSMEWQSTEVQSTERRPIGLQIKIARIERGIKQFELAQKISMHPSTLGQIERGERVPTPKQLAALRQALGLTSAAA